MKIIQESSHCTVSKPSTGKRLLYINKLSKRLGGSYLSNLDLQDDLTHFGGISRLLLIDNCWNNQSAQNLPEIEKQQTIFYNVNGDFSQISKEQLKRIAADIIHSQNGSEATHVIILGHESLIWLVPVLKSLIKGVKICSVHHGTPTHSLTEMGRTFRNEFNRHLVLVDFFITVSPHLSEIISSAVTKEVVTVPNFPRLPIASEQSLPMPPGTEIRILQVSTMRNIKRPLDGISLHHHLIQRGNKVSLTYVGAGELFELFTQCASHEIAKGSIQVIPFANRSEIARHIASNHFVFLPSEKEGFPRVVIEAMSRGRIVVASEGANKCGLIRDGETGLLFKTGSISEAADKISAVRSQVDRRELIVRKGYEVVAALGQWRNDAMNKLIEIIDLNMPNWRN